MLMLTTLVDHFCYILGWLFESVNSYSSKKFHLLDREDQNDDDEINSGVSSVSVVEQSCKQWRHVLCSAFWFCSRCLQIILYTASLAQADPSTQGLARQVYYPDVYIQGCQEDWGGAGQIQKVGLHKIDCVRGVLGHATRKFWDFTCSGGSWGSLSCMHTCTYIPSSCHLRLAVSDRKVRCMGPYS